MAKDLVATPLDFTHLVWSERVNTSGTGGTFLKARERLSRTTRYYKLSCYDSYRGVYGHECANELVASRLMDALGVPHVSYRLLHAQVLVGGVLRHTWMSESEEFKGPGDKKTAFDLFYDLHKLDGESPLELCDRFGWRRQIERMMGVDFLIANRDRHGANIEVLRSPGGEPRLAPLFDNGLSFAFSCYGDEGRVRQFDSLSDVNANNFIGTRSLEENLGFISETLDFKPLSDECIESLFRGLEQVLPEAHQEKMKEMLRLRWSRLVERGLVLAE